MTTEAKLWPLDLEGNMVTLREFRDDDLDAVAAIVGDDRVTRFLSFDTRTLEQAGTMLVGAIQRASAQPRQEFYLAVVPRDIGTVVGFARLELTGVKAAKLGYAIGYEHQGKGFASDAVSTLVDFGFGTLGLHRITAAIGPHNAASHAVAQRLGFRVEGVLRDHVFTNGRWRDSVLYSVLEHEWQPPGPPVS